MRILLCIYVLHLLSPVGSDRVFLQLCVDQSEVRGGSYVMSSFLLSLQGGYLWCLGLGMVTSAG